MTAKKEEKEELSSRSKGIFLLVVCVLLLYWRGPGLVDDIQLFGEETVVATMESKRTVARNDVFYFYFLANGDTIRNESGMFAPLMAMTSRDNEDDIETFKVVYDAAEPEINYPRATLRIHFFISLIILIFASLMGIFAIGHFREKSSNG